MCGVFFMKKSKKAKKIISADNSELKNNVKMQLLNFIIYAIVFSVCVLISLVSGIKRSNMYYVSMLSFMLSSIICGYIAGFKVRKNGIYIGAVSILLQLVVFLLVSAAINNFKIDILRLVISIILMIISGGIGGILGVNTRLKPKKKRGR